MSLLDPAEWTSGQLRKILTSWSDRHRGLRNGPLSCLKRIMSVNSFGLRWIGFVGVGYRLRV